MSAAAQHLPPWPSDPCFLIAYDTVSKIEEFCAWLTIDNLVHNKAHRIVSKIINIEFPPSHIFTSINNNAKLFPNYSSLEDRLFMRGFIELKSPNIYLSLLNHSYSLQVALFIYKDFIGVNINRYFSYIILSASLEVVKYCVENYNISKKTLERGYLLSIRSDDYSIYRYLSQIVSNPISKGDYSKKRFQLHKETAITKSHHFRIFAKIFNAGISIEDLFMLSMLPNIEKII